MAAVEVYHLEINGYRKLKANEAGRLPIPELGIELGIWQGVFADTNFPWLRPWDRDGKLISTSDEKYRIFKNQLAIERQRTAQEKQHTEQEKQRAEQEKRRADKLAAQLKSLGINPGA